MATRVKYRCITHGIEVEVGETRSYTISIDPRKGSDIVKCLLPSMREIKEGKLGECEVVKVG